MLKKSKALKAQNEFEDLVVWVMLTLLALAWCQASMETVAAHRVGGNAMSLIESLGGNEHQTVEMACYPWCVLRNCHML